MGFIEALRKQKATEEEARGQEYLKAQKTSEEKRQVEEKERDRTRQLVVAARVQFDESGVIVFIDELLKIERSLRFERVIDFYGKETDYKCEVILRDVDPHYDRSTKIFIGIDTTLDGTIKFKGDPEKGTSVVPKNIWQKNKGVLEEALGKAYKNPQNKGYDFSNSRNWETSGQGRL